MVITNQIFEHYRQHEKKIKEAVKLLKEDERYIVKKLKNEKKLHRFSK